MQTANSKQSQGVFAEAMRMLQYFQSTVLQQIQVVQHLAAPVAAVARLEA
jgi:hypothetical protein